MAKPIANGVAWLPKSIGNSVKLPVPSIDFSNITSDTITVEDLTAGNLTTENLNVTGTISYMNTENTIMADRFVYLGANSPESATTSGIISQVEAIGAKIALNAPFESGTLGVSQPRVGITSGSFVADQLVSITGAITNDGLYEVHSSDATHLYVRGVGLVDTATITDGLAGRDFTSEEIPSTGAYVQKVSITVIRNSLDGMEVATANSASGLNYRPVVTDTNATNLQNKQITNSTLQIDEIDTSTGTVTLPAGSGTLITTDSVAMLENKNLVDTSCKIQKWGDPTATVRFDATGVSGDRVLTAPNESGTIALTSQVPSFTTFSADRETYFDPASHFFRLYGQKLGNVVFVQIWSVSGMTTTTSIGKIVAFAPTDIPVGCKPYVGANVQFLQFWGSFDLNGTHQALSAWAYADGTVELRYPIVSSGMIYPHNTFPTYSNLGKFNVSMTWSTTAGL